MSGFRLVTEGDTGRADNLTAELREFIGRVIVPILVEKVLAETQDLYSAAASYYDDEEPLAQAA